MRWPHEGFFHGYKVLSLQFMEITLLFAVLQGDGFDWDSVLSQPGACFGKSYRPRPKKRANARRSPHKRVVSVGRFE
jgi:hypothetical protein